MQWYISAAAVKQYVAICGYSADDDAFDRAAKELEVLTRDAKLAQDVDEKHRSQLWRVKATVRGKRTRLEFVVSLAEREEGSLPQLIAVRNKGR